MAKKINCFIPVQEKNQVIETVNGLKANELVAKIYAEISAYAESQDKSFVEYMAESVKRGALENHEVKGLAQNTNYYLLVFGVDAEAEYATTTDVTAVKFTASAKEKIEKAGGTATEG